MSSSEVRRHDARAAEIAAWAADQRSIASVRQMVRDGRLRDARESYGVTQRALAEAGHCTASAIAQYESGARIPSEAIALRLARALEALREVGK